jgi:radical SAM protein with 4Fe4S-binding SPASM domain
MGIPRALVPTDKRFAVPDLTFANGPCQRPLIRLILRHDGEMCFCCEDMKAEFGLGNIHSASLEALWYSDKHKQLVNDLLAGRRDKHTLCRNCPLYPSSPPSKGERIGFKKRNYAVLEGYGKVSS